MAVLRRPEDTSRLRRGLARHGGVATDRRSRSVFWRWWCPGVSSLEKSRCSCANRQRHGGSVQVTPRAGFESVNHGDCPDNGADRTDLSPVDVRSARLGDRLHGPGECRLRLPGLLRRLVSCHPLRPSSATASPPAVMVERPRARHVPSRPESAGRLPLACCAMRFSGITPQRVTLGNYEPGSGSVRRGRCLGHSAPVRFISLSKRIRFSIRNME